MGLIKRLLLSKWILTGIQIMVHLTRSSKRKRSNFQAARKPIKALSWIKNKNLLVWKINLKQRSLIENFWITLKRLWKTSQLTWKRKLVATIWRLHSCLRDKWALRLWRLWYQRKSSCSLVSTSTRFKTLLRNKGHHRTAYRLKSYCCNLASLRGAVDAKSLLQQGIMTNQLLMKVLLLI